MKKQGLISLLTIPIIAFAGCTNLSSNQIRIADPFKKSYRFTIIKDGEKQEINAYSNWMGISKFIEVKRNNKEFIYESDVPGYLKSIDIDGKRYDIRGLSKYAKIIALKQFRDCSLEVLKEKQRQELKDLE